MTGHVVVGYTATDAGADALAVGVRLARALGATLHPTVVLPDNRSVITPPDASYDRYVREQASGWMQDALASVPDDVTAAPEVRYAESFAEGLVTLGNELHAGYIVIGAAGGGLRGRHRLGSVATELLHSADVPVVLAPKDARTTTTPITRITVAVGTRPGAEVLLEESVALAALTQQPLRLLSLVTVDLPASMNTEAIRITGAAHVSEVLAQVKDALPAEISATAQLASGASVEEAVLGVQWDSSEIVVVGSSRLASPRRLFLGSTAAKMLHELEVPMIVVPRTREQEGERA